MSDAQKAFLTQFPDAQPIDVAWSDMDALQHVNNKVYFRYFEIARIELFARTGLFAALESDKIGPVLADNYARYKRPVTYPDHLLVGVGVSEISDTGFVTQYTVFSTSQQAVACEGQARIVMFDFKNNEKAPLNDTMRAFLQSRLNT